ncbi:hypothetical protein NKH65_24145, partial [Mesorhizobium australicum]
FFFGVVWGVFLGVFFFVCCVLLDYSLLVPVFFFWVAPLWGASAGAGVLLGSRPLIDAALYSGALVRLSDFELPSTSGHFLTRPSTAHLTSAEQDFRQWLLKRLAGKA